MRIATLVILIVILIAVGWQVFSLAKDNQKVKDKFKKLANQLELVKKEKKDLRTQYEQ